MPLPIIEGHRIKLRKPLSLGDRQTGRAIEPAAGQNECRAIFGMRLIRWFLHNRSIREETADFADFTDSENARVLHLMHCALGFVVPASPFRYVLRIVDSHPTIRQALPTDASAVVSIDNLAQTSAHRAEFIRRKCRDGSCFVCEMNGSPVGYAVLEYSFFENGM